MNSSNDVPSGDGAFVWQPAMMAHTNTKTDARKSIKYPGMQKVVINVFSGFCIALGVASIGVQIAALVIYATSLYNYVWFAADVSGHGIWAGSFYVITGSLGIASTNKRTKSLLVWTVVMSGLSIASSIASSTLSGIAASDGVGYNCYYSYQYEFCDDWLALEWSLMGIAILASISSIVLIVVTSVPLCCSKSSNKNAGNQQGVYLGAGMGQKPMFFNSQQPMQQYHPQQPNFLQSSNVPQQLQQQQPQMQYVAAPTAQYTQAQQQAPISVPQQTKPSGSETGDIIKVQQAAEC